MLFEPLLTVVTLGSLLMDYVDGVTLFRFFIQTKLKLCR